MALLDLRAAHTAGRPFLFASHSIGPLGDAALERLRRAELIVSREPDTHDYLAAHGIASHAAADLAFLFPLPSAPLRPESAPYRLAFLRADSLDLERLRFDGAALHCGERELLGPATSPIVLATSDSLRDRGALEALAARDSRIGIRICQTVNELVAVVAGASEVATDRYHPAVLAALLGKPVAILDHPGWHKLAGLERLLATRSLDEIRAQARSGLERVSDLLRAARR
jgi:polysaccharide pyruvyl transferase WcaK-like protein